MSQDGGVLESAGGSGFWRGQGFAQKFMVSSLKVGSGVGRELKAMGKGVPLGNGERIRVTAELVGISVFMLIFQNKEALRSTKSHRTCYTVYTSAKT